MRMGCFGMAKFDNEHTANTELDVVLFESSDGAVSLPVNIEEETVWLTQAQMAELFNRSIGAISRHIKNVFDEKELVGEGNLHFLQIANADRPVAFYSLDVIISVGYRVKSQRGVEFRRWATSILRQYILKGHVENDERLRQLGTVARIIERLPHELGSRQILDIVESYTDAFRLLDEFDREAVARPRGTTGTFVLEYDACMELISQMHPRFVSDIFGVEKDDSFRSSISAIYQGFAGQELYPSIEEKAANLLYFIIKNHSFIDGNKRIACSLFLYFLDRNGLLFNGLEKRVSDSTLVAVALMIAESRPEEKESMVALVMNFLS